MDPTRFDHLARALGRSVSRRGAFGVLAVGTALAAQLGGVAAAPQGTGKQGGGQGQPKFPVCHNGETQVLPLPAAQAHLAHGDTPGTCSSLEGGACVPLLQICVPGANPCCDKEASCVAAEGEFDIHFCLDRGCTSDQECLARYPDNPDVQCRPRLLVTCPKNVKQCCQRRNCSRTNPCEAGVCCDSIASGLREVCCAPGQRCDPFTGCTT